MFLMLVLLVLAESAKLENASVETVSLSLVSNVTLETTTILAAKTASSLPTLVMTLTLALLESDAVELDLDKLLATLETTSALPQPIATTSPATLLLEPVSLVTSLTTPCVEDLTFATLDASLDLVTRQPLFALLILTLPIADIKSATSTLDLALL